MTSDAKRKGEIRIHSDNLGALWQVGDFLPIAGYEYLSPPHGLFKVVRVEGVYIVMVPQEGEAMTAEREAILAILTDGNPDAILSWRPNATTDPARVLLWVSWLLSSSDNGSVDAGNRMRDLACIAIARYLDDIRRPAYMRRTAIGWIEDRGLGEDLAQWRGTIHDGEEPSDWERASLEMFDRIETVGADK